MEDVGLAVIYCFNGTGFGSWIIGRRILVRILYGTAPDNCWLGFAYQMELFLVKILIDLPLKTDPKVVIGFSKNEGGI